MTTHSHWEIAALAKTMAMKVTVELNPEHITPRIKNSIKKQLRAGVITGGWQSQAAKIADQLVRSQDLPVTRKQWRGMHIGTITMDQKRRIADIYRADWTAYTLEHPGFGNSTYYKGRYAETMHSLVDANSSDFFVGFQQRQFNDQAHAVLAESITPEQWHQIEQAITLLDRNEPIHITTYQ
jgi:hypothetical protein